MTTKTKRPDSFEDLSRELEIIRAYGLKPTKREVRQYCNRLLRLIEAEHPEVAQ